MDTRDIFLCHADSDKELYVRPLASELRKWGVTFWLDEAEIRVGESIVVKISEGLSRSRFVVVFVTEEFLIRTWPQLELRSALEREASSGERTVLPIVSIPHELFVERFPLLRDKLYLRWTGNLAQIAKALVTSIGDSFEQHATLFFPVEYKGPVWIRFLQHLDNTGYEHQYALRWGPWLCKGTFYSFDPAVCFNMNKGPDLFAVPLLAAVSPACNVRAGVGSPPCYKSSDINHNWHWVLTEH